MDFPPGRVASGVVEMHQITPARDGLESGFVFLPQQFATVSTPQGGSVSVESRLAGDFLGFSPITGNQTAIRGKQPRQGEQDAGGEGDHAGSRRVLEADQTG